MVIVISIDQPDIHVVIRYINDEENGSTLARFVYRR